MKTVRKVLIRLATTGLAALCLYGLWHLFWALPAIHWYLRTSALFEGDAGMAGAVTFAIGLTCVGLALFTVWTAFLFAIRGNKG